METRKKEIGEGNMKGKRKWLLCPLIVVALLLCAIPAYADMPTLPHAFYGTLTITGSPAPVGTVVTAKVNEVECGSITTTVAGQYGGSGAFDPKLTVTGEIENGATIEFYVGVAYTGEAYDYAFSPGAVTEHNLVVGIDDDPPEVDLTPLSPDPTNDNTPTFTGTAVDALSNIASVEYQVGTGSWRAWVAATAVDGAFDEPSEEYTFTIPALADGGYTVQVRATDAASPPNTTLEANYATDAFTVDATAPTVVSRYPASGATGVALDTVVTATFSEAMNASTITTSSFTLKIGTTPVSGSVSYNAGTYTATFTPSANLTDDTIYTASLSTAVTDVAGNALGAASTWNFTTGVVPDITPPSVTVSDIVTTTDTTPTFTGTATDTQSNIASVEYRVDSGSWVAATASDGTFDSLSEGYTFTTSTLSAGEHTVYVRATDAASPPNTTLAADYATDTFTVNPPGVIPGDANGDGVVDILDVTKTERIIAMMDAETPGADANEDGVVDILDVTKIERIIALLD
jgi:hypothetical protein